MGISIDFGSAEKDEEGFDYYHANLPSAPSAPSFLADINAQVNSKTQQLLQQDSIFAPRRTEAEQPSNTASSFLNLSQISKLLTSQEERNKAKDALKETSDSLLEKTDSFIDQIIERGDSFVDEILEIGDGFLDQIHDDPKAHKPTTAPSKNTAIRSSLRNLAAAMDEAAMTNGNTKPNANYPKINRQPAASTDPTTGPTLQSQIQKQKSEIQDSIKQTERQRRVTNTYQEIRKGIRLSITHCCLVIFCFIGISVVVFSFMFQKWTIIDRCVLNCAVFDHLLAHDFPS